MKKILEWLYDIWFPLLCILFISACIVIGGGKQQQGNQALKDYKDGIQNHLVWSNTGKCFFVRPNDDVTVYLIQVPDCNKGN